MLRFRPLLWPTLFALAAMTILVGLGLWQLERRAWKLALIDRVERNLRAEPMDLATALARGIAESEFKAVRLVGKFQHDKEIHLFAHRGPEVGYEVITPLEQADGSIVLVNRGFVPERLKDPSARPEGQASTTARVTGWIRKGEERQWYNPEDDRAANRWFTRDPRAMAAVSSIEIAEPIFIVADETPNPGGWPKGGMQLNLRNQHLAYALTWFGLGAVLIAVYMAFHISRGRLGWHLPR